MPISSAAALVKILNTDPAPSPTSVNGCGWTVSPRSSLSPYVRLSPIASTGWASRPGLITLITLATLSSVGLATVLIAFFTLSWTVGSRVVLMR